MNRVEHAGGLADADAVALPGDDTAARIVSANFDALQFEPCEAFGILDRAMVWKFRSSTRA